MGVLLLGAAAAIALLAAASLRLQSLVSFLLAAYVALVANLGLVTWALSPIRAVARPGLAIAETALLGLAVGVWRRRGRPAAPWRSALPAIRSVAADPVCAVFIAAIGCLFAYEVVIGLTVPANNWDSLTYHLSRVAAWVTHGGVYHIENAPTPRMNEYQPLAEQQLLFLFAATRTGVLYALPQLAAECAILVAVYGTARRLGFEPRPSVCAALLFACFPLVVFQASTAQNDLFAASFVVVAACLLLGPGTVEPLLAGAAAGMGVGAKLTTALVLPVLLALAFTRGRRATVAGLAGAAGGFVAIGMWGFALNLAHTGRLLGAGGTSVPAPPWTQPVRPSSFARSVDVLYETFDVAAFSDRRIHELVILGVALALAAAGVCLFLRRAWWRAGVTGIGVAVPLAAPYLVLHASDAVAWLAREWGFPVRGHLGNVGSLNRLVQYATFGAVGDVLFLGVPLVTAVAFAVGRADVRQLLLAASVPLVYAFLGHETFNYFMTRFLGVAAVLVAPLFARLLANRAAAALYLVVATVVAGLAATQDPARPLAGREFGRPWDLTWAQAAALTDEPRIGNAVAAYDRRVPRHACTGAVLGGNEPGYLLSGPGLEHRVVYLPVADALAQAYRHLLSYVVISNGDNRWAAGSFRAAGWSVSSLGGYWLLAVAPHAGDGDCSGERFASPQAPASASSSRSTSSSMFVWTMPTRSAPCGRPRCSNTSTA